MTETTPRPPGEPAIIFVASGKGRWMALLAAFLGWMFDGFEMGLFPLVARPALQDLLGVTDASVIGPWFGLMIAVFLVGAATGGVLFGWLGDRVGRVRAMVLSVLTYSLFMGACGFATTVEQVFVLRFLSALGMGGEWSLGVALVMEIWPNRSRAMLAGLIGAAANFGFLLVGVIGLGLGKVITSMDGWLRALGIGDETVDMLVSHSGWRLMMIVGAIPALLTFMIRIFVPESERWLHEKKQGATSHWANVDLLGVLIGASGPLLIMYLWAPQTDLSMAVRIAGSLLGLAVAIGGYSYPIFRYLRRASVDNRDPHHGTGPTLRRMLLGACLSGVALLGTWGSLQWAAPWADQLVERSPEAAAMSPNDRAAARSEARSYTGMLSALGAIIGTMLGALVGDMIGRRATYALLCAGSLISSLVFYQLNTGYGGMFLVTVFIAGGITASFYGWLPLYLPELFRTNVRATGQGFSFNFGRIIAAVGALQTGSLMAVFAGDRLLGDITIKGGFPLACSVMSLIYLVGLGLILLAPETRGQPLPD